MRIPVGALALVLAAFGAIDATPATAATITISNTNDLVNGDTTTPGALRASPGPDGISLREAMLAANNRPGPHALTFATRLADKTIVLTGPLPPISRSGITLAGLTNADTGQPSVTIDGSIGGHGPMMFVAASSFTVSDLTILMPPQFSAIQIGGAIHGSQGQLLAASRTLSGLRVLRSVFHAGGDSNHAFAIAIATSLDVTRNASISDVVIDGNTFQNMFEGVNVQGSGRSNVIRDVVIQRNVFSQMTAPATSAVEIAGHNGRRNSILGTRILHNVFAGNFSGVNLNNNRDAGPPCGCIDTTTAGNVIDDTVIEGNMFTGNLEAIGMAAGTGQPGFPPVNNTISNTRIVNNVINRTGYQHFDTAAGIHVFDNQNGAMNNRVNGLSIVNNTIHGPGPMGGGVWVESAGGVTQVSVRNTIFWGGSPFGEIAGVPPSRVRYSIIDQDGITGINHNVNVEPLFKNPARGNFRLKAGSPAFRAGNPTDAPATDRDCQPRGTRPSIGAYQRGGPDICLAD